MSVFDHAARSIDLLRVALHGLRTIGDLAHDGLGQIDAAAALRAIVQIVESLKSGWRGEVEAKAIQEAIDQLRANLVSNDRAADAALDRKFPA